MRAPLQYTRDDFLKAKAAGLKLGHSWQYFPQWDLCILAPPKCGSSSIKQFIWVNEIPVEQLKHHQVKGEVVCVVREPVSRFRSLWRSKCRDKGRTRYDNQIHGISPSELMTFIERGNKDVHFTRQSDMIKNLRPTLIPLEHLDRWWSNRGYGELGHFNETEGEVELSESLIKRIETFYKEDVKLYNISKTAP